MNLTIDLSPTEEARLSAAAKQRGLDAAGLVKRLVEQHLPAIQVIDASDLEAKLRKWQEQDGTKLTPDVSTQSLFAEWAEEDRSMTDEEREAEDRLWDDLEQGLTGAGRTVHLRRLTE